MNKLIPIVLVGVVVVVGVGYALRRGGQKVNNPPTDQNVPKTTNSTVT